MAMDAIVSAKGYTELLGGVEESVARAASQDLGRDLINLQGKFFAMDAQLQAFVERRAPGEQIVIFVKEQFPAQKFMSLLQKHKLSVLTAGVMGARKLSSLANIENFRRRGADVLLISNRYCDGFDLYMAREVWFMNTDLSAAKMEQSQGRVQRVAQLHPKVTVRIFVYRNTFDDWLWESRKTLNVKGGYNKTHVLLFYLFAMKNRIGTRAHRYQMFINQAIPDLQNPVTAKSNPLTLIFDSLRINIEKGTVSGPHREYRLTDVEGMGQRELRTLLFSRN